MQGYAYLLTILFIYTQKPPIMMTRFYYMKKKKKKKLTKIPKKFKINKDEYLSTSILEAVGSPRFLLHN